jgi:hypothetical protein
MLRSIWKVSDSDGRRAGLVGWSDRDREAGFHAATAVVQLMYLPFAIVHLGEHRAAAMIERALTSVGALK